VASLPTYKHQSTHYLSTQKDAQKIGIMMDNVYRAVAKSIATKDAILISSYLNQSQKPNGHLCGKPSY
jgi:hypothetical protein